MPIDYSRYPANWKEISLRIRERDGWRCEWCGAVNGQPNPRTGAKVVLTVAHHPDPDPYNCDDCNLHSLCQQCHNALDAPMRAKHAADTRRQRKIESGQSEFDLTVLARNDGVAQ